MIHRYTVTASQTKLKAFLSGLRIVWAPCDWMFSSRLQFHASKTEVMWCSYGRRAPQLYSKSVVICSDLIQPLQSVCNLGIWLDSDCFMITHINKQLVLTMHLSEKFVTSLLHSHLMYGSFSLHLLSYQRLITAIQLWSTCLPPRTTLACHQRNC